MAKDTSSKEFIVKMANWIIEKNGTCRSAATEFGVSKSKVHRDMKLILPDIDLDLHKKAMEVIYKNKQERYYRGGQATKNMYEKLSAPTT